MGISSTLRLARSDNGKMVAAPRLRSIGCGSLPVRNRFHSHLMAANDLQPVVIAHHISDWGAALYNASATHAMKIVQQRVRTLACFVRLMRDGRKDTTDRRSTARNSAAEQSLEADPRLLATLGVSETVSSEKRWLVDLPSDATRVRWKV